MIRRKVGAWSGTGRKRVDLVKSGREQEGKRRSHNGPEKVQ